MPREARKPADDLPRRNEPRVPVTQGRDMTAIWREVGLRMGTITQADVDDFERDPEGWRARHRPNRAARRRKRKSRPERAP
jgi:hypothetical protein